MGDTTTETAIKKLQHYETYDKVTHYEFGENGYVHKSIEYNVSVLADGPDANGKGIDGETLDAPAEVVTTASALETPPPTATATNALGTATNPSGWDSLATKILMGLAITGLTVALIASLHSHSHSGYTGTVLSAPQAAILQVKLIHSVANTSTGLSAAGFSGQTIRHAQNMVTLDQGTRIAQATVVSARDSRVSSPHILGDSSPDHYANLLDANAGAYVRSLSRRPTNSQILENSAVVHGLSTTQTQ